MTNTLSCKIRGAPGGVARPRRCRLSRAPTAPTTTTAKATSKPGSRSVNSSTCVVPTSPCTTQRRLICGDGLLELPTSLAELDYEELEQLEGLLEDRLESLTSLEALPRPDVALQVHGSTVTTLVWLDDSTLLSAGLDKTVSFVELAPAGDEIDEEVDGMDGMNEFKDVVDSVDSVDSVDASEAADSVQTEDDVRMTVAKRIILSGGPVHSVLPTSNGVILGLHSNSLLELVSPASSDFLQDMQYSVLESNLCGWPRDLASNGTSLFSASCNEIKQFSLQTKKSKVYRLDRGDILSLVCTKDRLFAGTVDGSLFAFSIDAKTGALELTNARPKAHAGRVTSLKTHRGMLLSSSYDGTVKSWGQDDLEIVASAKSNGARVLALAHNGKEGGLLYAAGSDGTIRAFDPIVLEERDVIVPALDEDEGIRALAARGNTLIAGTSAGKLIRC